MTRATQIRRPGAAPLRPTQLEWWILPEPLLDRIKQKRHEDGYRSWSFERIGAQVQRTGAAIRKVCDGKTRQPDIQVVDRLAALLGIDRSVFTAGTPPETAASRARRDELQQQSFLGWLDESLQAGLERVTDPAAQSLLNNGIRIHLTVANDLTPTPTSPTSPPTVHPTSVEHHGPGQSWRVAPEKIEASIRRFAAQHPHRQRSNAAIGRAIGLSDLSVGRIRRGEVRQPDLVALHRLAALLDTSVGDLATGDVPQFATTDDPTPPTVRCLWLSDENRAGLDAVVDPGRRAAVQRGIRLLLEAEARAKIASTRERRGLPHNPGPVVAVSTAQRPYALT